ncbi:MAG TPA: hypothetical protein VL418_06960 [Devosiaceae bacterium]|nr:hypothetical protein [Devosiaceae bacterium]
MELLLLGLTIGLPVFKILLFPARAIGRGGNWTWVGAAMIVGLMMVLWFSVQSLTGTEDATVAAPSVRAASATDKADAAAAQQAADAILKVLLPQG